MNYGYIFDDATIAQGDRNNLVIHPGLWLSKEELAPGFRQRGDIHLTRQLLGGLALGVFLPVLISGRQQSVA